MSIVTQPHTASPGEQRKQDEQRKQETRITRARLVQRLVANDGNLPEFMHDLITTQAVVVAGTEAIAFLVEGQQGDGKPELRTVAHVRPDNSEETVRHQAIMAFREIVTHCILKDKDGAPRIGEGTDEVDPQFCLVTLLRNENRVVAATAVITRCKDEGRALQRLSTMQLVAGYFDFFLLKRENQHTRELAKTTKVEVNPVVHRPARRRRNLVPWIAALAVFLALGIGGAWYLIDQRAGSGGGRGLTFEVASGPMVVSVTESGTIKAAEQEILRAEVEGRTTIITLVPEGTVVKKGDLLVELDTSEMEDEKLEDTIEVQNAESAFIRAREDLEVAKNQALADVAQAKLDYQFAIEDLQKYKEGEYPNLETEAESKIEIAKEELRRAEDQYQGSLELFENDFISATELQADELALSKAKLELKLAEQALILLREWEYKRQIAQLESDVEQKRLALERAERKASADVVQAEADLKAKQSELERQQDGLARVTAQIGKAKIYAPRDGLVVYATSAQGGGFRGNQEPLQEGQEVRERQELIYLPTATQMIAETKIHESSLEKVRLGMPVRITIDALPGKSYRGEVTKIAPLPDANSMWMNPDLKVYNTIITIEGNGEELRTGMSCRAEIIVENYDKTTYVPVQSIVRVSGVPTAFVLKADGSLDQREVEIGQDNNRMVVIKSGLEPGEKVLLAPPLGETGTVETLRPEELTAEEKQKAEEAKDNPGVEPAEMPEGGMPMNGVQGGEGQRGGGGGMAAMQQLREKATPEEQTKLREFFQNQDMEGGQAYLKELGEKYGIDTSSMTGMGGARPQGGQNAGPGGPDRGDGPGRGDRSGADGERSGGARNGRSGDRPDDDDAAPAAPAAPAGTTQSSQEQAH